MELIKFPETDHSLCLNCQVSKGNPHLCGSCQWYASNVFDDLRNQKLVDRKLDEIDNEIYLDVINYSVSDLIEELKQNTANGYYHNIKGGETNQKLFDVLEQIKETGLNHSR
jgi:hypothetical protein